MTERPKGYHECPDLHADIEAFLAAGGTVKQCPPATFADFAGRQAMRRENKQNWERRQLDRHNAAYEW